MAAALLPALALLTACDPASIPKDPKGAYAEAAGAVLRVGVSENRPWIVKCEGEPVGLEAELLSAFAQELDAKVEWVWASPPELMRALGNYELRLVAGGIEQTTPWKAKVGLTRPYLTVPICIGSPDGSPIPGKLNGIQVGISTGSPAAKALKDRGAEAVYLDNVWEFPGLIVASAWELDARGYRVEHPPLAKSPIVFAAPKGENRLISQLELFLGRQHDLIKRYETAALALPVDQPCPQAGQAEGQP